MDAAGEREIFEAAVESHGGEYTTTTAEAFETALTNVLEKPAVGVPLPLAGLNLDETPIETDLTPAALQRAQTGVTPVRFGIASLGTVFIESRPMGDELVSLFPERHVSILASSDLVPDLETAVETLDGDVLAESMSGVLATGPSATADMGATVEGVHGPRDVHVIEVIDR